jgi:hypothetical protein
MLNEAWLHFDLHLSSEAKPSEDEKEIYLFALPRKNLMGDEE